MSEDLEDLHECRTGECLPSEEEIRERFKYVKGIRSRTGGKVFHVIEAKNGYHAFIEIKGRFYATGSYSTLEKLEGYIF